MSDGFCLDLEDPPGMVECAECRDVVDEFEAIAERWRYWSDGTDLVPFCPDCAEREFHSL